MIHKKHHWKFHTLILSVSVLMHLFQSYIYGGPESFFKIFEYPYNLFFLSFHFVLIIIYFLNFYVLAPRTLPQKKIVQYILGVFVLIFAFAGLRYVIEEVVLFNVTGVHNYYENSRRFFYYIFDNSYSALQAILLSISLYLVFLMLEGKDRLHQLELNQKKAELSLLKTQLEPHFLFNTLNSFYTELIDTQPKTAKDIFKLSQLLRYVTYETQQDFVPLDKEIQFVEDFIHFQRKRFEDNLFLEYQVEGIVAGQHVPSLVIIHFVENIFKHGVLNDPNNPAKFDMDITNETLEIKTSNHISSSEKYSEKGIGEANLRRRLTAIYKDNFTLTFKKNDLHFSSYLSLPLKNN